MPRLRGPRTVGPPPAAIDYRRFSELSGPLREPSPTAPYQVEFTSLLKRDGTRGRGFALTGIALVVEAGFLVWLLQPGHFPVNDGSWKYWLSMTMIAFIAVIEGLRLVNVATLARATLASRDPIPVAPEAGLRIAFITTIVPAKEPISVLRATLEAACRIHYDGLLDLWLLDEGDNEQVKAMCSELGVKHFTRKGIERWNQPAGPNQQKTKHGNYNAWLEAHGGTYDLWISVDSDHVPLANMADRLIGYFRDPDVAFVVGPQVYGNYDNFVTKAAESQQYLFHSVLQRAANKWGAAMFVGTNNAVRISALRSIGGLADSITEDAATGLKWHGSRNSETTNFWKSVYTPDVLAVGEGPANWTDYFSQQHRWARGTNSLLRGRFAWITRRLPRGRRCHYLLLLSYYPSAALSWVLGNLNVMLYLCTGVGAVQISGQLWLMLYVDAAALQIGMYFWNRRFNVSPHEQAGSSGIAGMFISVLSAPIYVAALLASLRRRAAAFTVTPKGDDSSTDRPRSFRLGNAWGVLLSAALAGSVVLGHHHASMQAWAVLGIVISFGPMAIWTCTTLRARTARWKHRKQTPNPAPGLRRVPAEVGR